MPKVDSKGRIVLPQDVRERLGIDPGTEVEIREEEGKAVVEPEDDPDRIIDDIEELIEDAASHREQPSYDDLDVHEKSHVDTIQQQANETESGDE